MKLLIPIAFCFCIFEAFTQNQTSVFISPNMPNSGVLSHLIDFPDDASKLLLIESQGGITPTFNYHELDHLGNIGSAPILGCNDMSTSPIRVPNGILFGGNTFDKGTEPIFFNGTQSIVIDMIPGAGSSDPVFFESGGRNFFIAFDGVTRQLFEFISPTDVVQISNETSSEVYGLSGFDVDEVFYQTTINNTSILKKAQYISGSYFTTGIRFQNQIYNWRVLGDIGGVTLIQEVKSAYSGTNYFVRRLLSYDSQAILSPIMEDSLLNFEDPPYGFGAYHNGGEFKIYTQNEIFTTNDGLNFVSELQVNGNQLRSHYVLNSEIYFLRGMGVNGVEISKYENGTFTSLYSGSHIHESLTSSHEVYFTDYAQENMSKFVRLNGSGQITVWNIKDSSTHPMVMNGATYFDSKPLFLWSNPSSMNNSPIMDIHTISSFLAIEDADQKEDFVLFPNPVSQGENVEIKINQISDVVILDQTGRVIRSVLAEKGENEIETTNLKSGIYLVRIEEKMKKLVVK